MILRKVISAAMAKLKRPIARMPTASMKMASSAAVVVRFAQLKARDPARAHAVPMLPKVITGVPASSMSSLARIKIVFSMQTAMSLAKAALFLPKIAQQPAPLPAPRIARLMVLKAITGLPVRSMS